uniref:Na_Ca_ex domain-containing protein n=1 Tax=Angiostrongylus cantonensis TaxID=6313 RepID=A0A158P7N5_ANGCA
LSNTAIVSGAAFSDSLLRGLSIGFAVVSQQFPQELGTLAILINSGLGFRRAMLFNLIPIFLSYLGFICGVLLDNIDEGYDDYIFSISSGMYLYIFLGTLNGAHAALNDDLKVKEKLSYVRISC